MKDRISPDITRRSKRAHLVIAKGLLDFLACGDKAEVYERRDADTRNGVPPEQIH